MSNDTTTPESEVKETSEETVNEEQETGDTVGVYQDEESDNGSEHIPKARLDKEINRRKELEAKLEALEKEKEADPEVKDVSKDPSVKELADKLANIEKNEATAKRDVALEKGLNKALDDAPEFKDVINVDFIKQMALNPANADKTFAQLLDEAYGNALGGKRTIESTTPRGGAKNEKVDIEKARRDNSYLKEVLADPVLRKQYNEGLENRIML